MGILVPECVLPSGIPISNVYMSFNSEVVYIGKGPDGSYVVQSHYKVYKDETKQPDANIRIPLTVQVDDISVGVFTYLYENLKQLYPNSIDC